LTILSSLIFNIFGIKTNVTIPRSAPGISIKASMAEIETIIGNRNITDTPGLCEILHDALKAIIMSFGNPIENLAMHPGDEPRWFPRPDSLRLNLPFAAESNYAKMAEGRPLMYLALATRPDISFAVSALSRYNSKPRTRHLNQARQILRYIKTRKP
jgi:hypothetical protein